jgi:hypothetical protein
MITIFHWLERGLANTQRERITQRRVSRRWGSGRASHHSLPHTFFHLRNERLEEALV